VEAWFDGRFVEVSARDYWQGRLRLAVTAGVALLLAATANWRPALVWAGCAIPLEAWLQASLRPIAEGEAPSRLRSWGTAILRLGQANVWVMAGMIFWSYGGVTGQAMAMAFYSVLLLYVVARRDRSTALNVAALPALAAPFITTLLFPAPALAQFVILLFSAVMAGLAAWCLLRDLAEKRSSQGVRAAPRASAAATASAPSGDVELSLESLLEAKAQAEAASQAKSVFLATMSHEIRTPLNGVLGMTQALAADPTLTPGHRARLQTIRQSGEALLAILNDILDLSKIEAGKLELESIEFDIGEIARTAHASFKPLAAEKRLDFKLEIRPEARGVYLGDPTRVRQVLFNLISNALKFTDRGEIGVLIERLANGDLRLSVSDSGVGIDPAHLDRIFGQFEQADATSTRRYGGTGLGLAICRDLCGLMGGAITAESDLGRGSRFVITLPLPKVSASMAAPSPQPPVETLEEAEAGGLRVLAAEDNATNQMVLKLLLSQAGIEPMVVENGALAVEAWRTSHFDLILMDIQMPVMDGIEAARTIRQEEAETGRARTPIIALTGNAMAHQVAEYAAVGMDAHVAKPIDVRVLFPTIEKLLAASEEPAPQRAPARAGGRA
jgi:signal transduction histidine kinase/ActR/RegA family two-component response regulator